jgi:uncharacterized protein
VAASIVRWRDAHGAFRNRQQLLDVTGLGPKTFEQAAGFLRIRDGDNPLDHDRRAPRDLPGGAAMLDATQRPMAELMGRSDVLRTLKPEPLPTSASAPSRSRTSWPSWKSPAATRARTSRWRASTTACPTLKDLQPGMLLEGTVSNVAQFGAFVDLGVHQDGLVHVSQLANKFVSDAREVVQDRPGRQGAGAGGGPGAQAFR